MSQSHSEHALFLNYIETLTICPPLFSYPPQSSLPYPAQGHVIPMLELSQWLVKHGVQVTFVNTEFNHERLIKSLSDSDNILQVVSMVSIPDGLEPWEARNDLGKLTEGIFKVMPVELESLIQNLNGNGGNKVTCVIADGQLDWAIEVAEKIGIKKAAFWPAAAATGASFLHIPKLVTDGIVDSDGRVLKSQMVQLGPNIPLMNSTNFTWASIGHQATQKNFFDMLSKLGATVKLADWNICNSSYDLEPGAFALLYPDVLPVGPLMASNRLGKSAGYLRKEDSACLAWLDQQPTNSVIYVAFGSSAMFDQTQFKELALGIELTNRPFLWVVRQDITADADEAYPGGFKDRVRGRGLMASWVPQQQVLSHPSVACFISHCGWNSTMEGISNGVPILCWPYFADQFMNETYICDEWKTGLRLSKDDSGIITAGEIKDKVENLLSDKSYKERASTLQAKTKDSFREGNSHKNFNNFIEWIKDN